MKNTNSDKKTSLMKIVFAALFAALTCVATMAIRVPSPTGYANLGDCFVLCSGWVLGPVWGTISAGVGSMFADIFVLGYVFYLNWIIGLLYLTCIIIIYVYEKIAFKRYEKYNTAKNDALDKTSTLLNEIIRGIRDIKIRNLTVTHVNS